MSSSGDRRSTAGRGGACILVVTVALTTLGAEAALGAAGRLRVCFLENDLPRAQRSPLRGFDVAVMDAVAAALGAELVPVWSPSRSGFSEIESTDLPLRRLAAGECDAVASVPGAETLGRLRSELVLSRPYYGAAFELVADDVSLVSLEELTGRRVGVRLQSLAHFVVETIGLEWRARPSAAQVLELLDAGAVDAALVWGPALALLERRPQPGWEPPRVLRWNEHVAVRREFSRLDAIDRALGELASSGALAEWAREYSIPLHPPFPSTAERRALAALRRGRSFSLGTGDGER